MACLGQLVPDLPLDIQIPLLSSVLSVSFESSVDKQWQHISMQAFKEHTHHNNIHSTPNKYQKQTSLDTEQISSIYIPITISKNKTRLIYQLNPNWALSSLQAIIVVHKHATSIPTKRFQFYESNKSGFAQKGLVDIFLWFF
jgi:hypothetical protein